MTDRDVLLSKKELMVLFNSLIEYGGKDQFKVTLPLLESLSVFQFGIAADGVKIENFISSDAYAKIHFPLMKRLKDPARKEIPSYSDIRQVLYQSGILKPDGLDQLEDILQDLKGQNIIRGGDVYYIALDTNLLRDRFYSVFFKDVSPHPNLDFILCETVRDELKNRKDKLTRNSLKEMEPLKYEVLMKCFLNQNCLEDRLRYVGFQEYNRMRSLTSCEEIDAPSARSGTQNDQYILTAYSDYVDIGRKVVFLSRDNEAVRMMTGEENVIPLLLEHPYVDQRTFSPDWKSFFNLLYMLGILYGKLDIVSEQTKICSLYGVWASKDAQEWAEDMFLLEFYGSPDGNLSKSDDEPKWRRHLKRNLALLQKLDTELSGASRVGV